MTIFSIEFYTTATRLCVQPLFTALPGVFLPSGYELGYLLLKQMDPHTYGRQERRQVDDLG